MANKKKIRLVPYDMVSPGFEAIYTGKESSSESEKEDIITTITSDNAGNEIIRWPVFSWTFPGQEKGWDEEVKHINNIQSQLGALDDILARFALISRALYHVIVDSRLPLMNC